MLIKLVEWVALFFSFFGYYLLAKKNKYFTVSWLISNIFWIIFAFYTKVYSQVILFSVYSAINYTFFIFDKDKK